MFKVIITQSTQKYIPFLISKLTATDSISFYRRVIIALPKEGFVYMRYVMLFKRLLGLHAISWKFVLNTQVIAY